MLMASSVLTSATLLYRRIPFRADLNLRDPAPRYHLSSPLLSAPFRCYYTIEESIRSAIARASRLVRKNTPMERNASGIAWKSSLGLSIIPMFLLFALASCLSLSLSLSALLGLSRGSEPAGPVPT